MRLTKRTHLIGGGRLGFDLSDPYDCHVYLINGGEELALIDAGSGPSIEPMIENIRFDGLDPSRLRYLLLTHAHADHAGAAAVWRERFGVEVIAAPEAARWVRDGDEERISLRDAKRAGIYPQDYEFRACEVVRDLSEGDTVSVGDVELQVFETPGHSAGMLSFLLDDGGHKCLFAGDTIFHGGKLAIIHTWDCNIGQCGQSVAKLHDLEFDALLPGHLTISLRDGKRHVNRAHQRFMRMEVPESIV